MLKDFKRSLTLLWLMIAVTGFLWVLTVTNDTRVTWLILVACLNGCLSMAKKDSILKELALLSSISITVGIIALKMNILPAVYSFSGLKTSLHAPAFSIVSNTTKMALALLFLPLISSLTDKKATNLPLTSLIYIIIAYLMVASGMLITFALLVNYIKFDFTYPSFFSIWLLNMLWICFSEEILFRGVVQNYLCRLLVNQRDLAVLAASLIFGLGHWGFGFNMVALSTAAGLFYGFLYKTTRRLWCPMVLHFGINLIHFIFFSYPYYI